MRKHGPFQSSSPFSRVAVLTLQRIEFFATPRGELRRRSQIPGTLHALSLCALHDASRVSRVGKCKNLHPQVTWTVPLSYLRVPLHPDTCPVLWDDSDFTSMSYKPMNFFLHHPISSKRITVSLYCAGFMTAQCNIFLGSFKKTGDLPDIL